MTQTQKEKKIKLNNQEIKNRKEIPLSDCWNVEALYASTEVWESEMKKWGREEKQNPRWPEISSFKGRIAENPKQLRALTEVTLDIDRHLSKLYAYAHLRHDEDVANDSHKKSFARITSLLYEFRQETSWIEPEILQMPETQISTYLASEELKEYRVYLEKIVRLKPHTLNGEKEELLALAGEALETSGKTFGAFNNADLKFPAVEDSQGNQLELTHGKYLLYLRERDRKLREEAFKAVHKTYFSYENTLCELINGVIQKHFFNKRARGYSSSLEAALFPNQIDLNVYSSLIEAVRKNLHSLHRYVALRKKLLNYDKLHFFDLHVPLVPEVTMSMNYQEGVQHIVDSVKVLGSQYQNDLEKGLKQDRWVDKYENLRKRSGAYSSGCYDSMPYILMNFHGTFNDVMTLAHEAGHSMHTLMSNGHQPYHYSHYPIFVAEVASTFNEELLVRHLVNNVENKEQRAFLINQKIEDIRSTLFRQTMFAEFELRLHGWVEQGVPLTPALLKSEYRKLNMDYFGEHLIIDDEIDIEWARIPHFYYNFYVYQYATGISAAHALVEKVLKEGEKAKQRYLQFLSSGSSRYPLELLDIAGVDMRKTQAIEATIHHFDELVQQLADLMT